ncbi:MAG: carbohydrate kinase [Agathobacter sp.]|nr:carbohydrate kinase [Agathobacter sp.]
MKEYDVIALGELLIDMTDNGLSEQGNTLFEANPGGAPCNVLAMLRKLNHKVGFIGKVGDDIFGHKLKAVLNDVGINTDNLLIDKDCRTTLAFVETHADGDRSFSFYRNPGADMMLRKEDINEKLLEQTKIFHFGTLSMTHEDARQATMYAVETAKKNGAIISFDPNIREMLWESLETAKEQVHYGLKMCDILKISDNEIQWLTGEQDFTAGVKKIRAEYDIPLILVSMGKDGSRAYYLEEGSSEIFVEEKAVLQKNTIETTGAGDTFMGCILHYILQKGLKGLKQADLSEMLQFANAAASIITTRKGALRVMPNLQEIEKMFVLSVTV